jgi:hypothetical protein
MDDLELAADYQSRDIAYGLTLRRAEAPAAQGVCLHCGEETTKRWCDTTCRDEYQDELRRRRR